MIKINYLSLEKIKTLSTDNKKLKEFEIFFKKLTGLNLRKIQRIWAKRLLNGKSQTLIAPTGIGKTVFGTVFSIYLARKGKKKCYLLFPTTTIINNLINKINEFKKKNSNFPNILFYHSELSKKEKDEVKEKIKNGEFNILITTYSFLSKDFKLFDNLKFDFIFVDDIDSMIKNSRNISKISELLHQNSLFLFASATGNPGKNAKLLKEKLGIETGAIRETLRKIEDLVISQKDITILKNVIKKLGRGGLIYTTTEKEARFVYENIKNEIKCQLFTTDEEKDFTEFTNGKTDVLIGISKPYGILVRGIDLPQHIRYALFWGVPAFTVNLNEAINETVAKALINRINRIEKNPVYTELLKKNDIAAIQKEIINFINKKSEDELLNLGIIKETKTLFLPDIKTYIQASGRTSRLFSGGITQGLSIIFDDKKYIDIFSEKALLWDIELKEYSDSHISEIIKKIDKDRQELKNPSRDFDPVKPFLFVVESPNKARQIAHFFGKPIHRKIGETTAYEIFSGEYVILIVATIGHILDITTENIGFYGIEKKGKDYIIHYSAIKRCRECNYQFTNLSDKCPRCKSENIYSSSERINDITYMACEMENVIIGTDPDTEGEKISWDVFNILKDYSNEIKRAEFHEVTRNAILKSIREKRDININLVNAQIIRRCEDRLTGFELSKKLQEKFRNLNLSAGRAQSPVLRWIVEREKELKTKHPFFINRDLKIKWKLPEVKKSGNIKLKFYIAAVSEYEKEKIIAPFRTDTMLRESQRILKLSANETMKAAQNLFESGLITYHRTDSTTVSEKGLSIAKLILRENFIPRKFETKGAHECIRPTKPLKPEDIVEYIKTIKINKPLSKQEISLYKLIFNRFIASQSKALKEKIRKYRIKFKQFEFEEERVIEASGTAIQFYPFASRIIPALPEGDVELNGEIIFLSDILPYTQADLIATMKEKGIGRPSTYATLIEKLFQRGYIRETKGYVRATPLGEKICKFIDSNFLEFTDEYRTKKLEQKMIDIENNKAKPQEILDSIYNEVKEISNKNL